VKWARVGFLFFCLLGSFFLWAGSGPKRPQTLLITNVNVVDTRYGSVHPRMAVAIKDDVIVALMKYAFIEPGPELQVVNGNGGYLIPGLWDMKTHVKGLPAESQKALFEFYLANGVTGIRDMNTEEIQPSSASDTLRPEVEPARPLWLQRTSASEIPSGWRHTIEDLSDILAVCCLHGSASQPALDDHGNRTLDQTAEEFSSQSARKAFVEISDHATWVVPGLVAEEGPVDSSEQETPPPHEKSASFSGEGVPAASHQLLRDLDLVRSMHRLGVQFLAGTGQHLDNLPKNTVAHELELLVKGGLTPVEALQSATINPALCMAKLNSYGVVEADHIADLVLLGGNPFEDIRNTRNVSAVVMRGQYLSRADLDAMLARAQHDLHRQSALPPVDAASRH
jgi:hypothetical protein